MSIVVGIGLVILGILIGIGLLALYIFWSLFKDWR